MVSVLFGCTLPSSLGSRSLAPSSVAHVKLAQFRPSCPVETSALRLARPGLLAPAGPSRLFSPSSTLVLPQQLDSVFGQRPSVEHQHRRTSVSARAQKGDDTVDASQRVLASVGYFLPFLDGAKYGRYLYLQYPFARAILDPVVPLVQLYNGLPFAGFIAFFLLYLGVIQNPSMSRYVRYNVMQAVILDILMILPSLFERLFSFQDGVGFQLTVVFYNTVFLYLLACFLFGVGSCILGKAPRLPLVSDAAEAQVPF